MGCGSSKNQIHVAPTSMVDNTKNDKSLRNKPPTNKSIKNRAESAQSRSKSGRSRVSDLGGSRSSVRGGSATSKASKHSCDSGFDDEGKIITESSNPNLVKEVEDEFDSPRELDLGLVGKACSQRLSAKDKDRMEEQRVMASLQNEGLIARPMSRAAFGVSFEVVENPELRGGLLNRRPPARLAKLEKRHKKKKRLTEEELLAKMERAEQRRKEHEHKRLAKIQAVAMNSDVTNALDVFAARQENVKTEFQAKEDQALENREKKLKEMRDKIQAKQEHATKVRQRKELTLNNNEIDSSEMEMFTSTRITEDTPIGQSMVKD